MNTPVGFSVDAEGIGWIVFDAPGSRANVFNPATQSALAAALTEAETRRPRALVIASGKETIFVAGADLKWLAELPDAATATEFSRTGQRLFQRIAESSVPVVCAIQGACVGGGFELALACHWRVAVDTSSTQIGLPETSLGTIPGWGGTVRLPRLLGAKSALDHILQARLLSAPAALEAGLIHEVAAAETLPQKARAAALKLVAEGMPVASPPPDPTPAFFRERRESVRVKTQGHLPALIAAIDAVEQGARLPLAEAFETEARIFGSVTTGEVCRNLVHVFFLREAARKRTLTGWFDDVAPPVSRLRPIRRVGVIGAGVMGSGIAQWLAARGFEVSLRDVRDELVARGMAVVRSLFAEAVERGKLSAGAANAGLHRIAPTTGWDGFESCDLVIEAIVEDVAAKRALFAEVAAVVPADAILASNTSALPIEEISGHVPNPARTVGLHFFNPVSRMPLVELIVGSHTSPDTAAQALDLVKGLGKSPVVCRSSPGFLVTRVLFFYLNAAVGLWERGCSTAAIDAALREFGWPMGPLRLIDEVGLDVTDFIFGEMEHFFPERFVRSNATRRLLETGLKGRKNGASRGFYRYDGGVETVNDPEILPLRGDASPTPRNAEVEVGPVGQSHDIAGDLMRVMAHEAERCLAESVVKSADEVDFALLSGAGFPAFRGGLLRWARRPTP